VSVDLWGFGDGDMTSGSRSLGRLLSPGGGYWKGRRPRPPPPRQINVLISLKILGIEF
jgi:hypothetical protein